MGKETKDKKELSGAERQRLVALLQPGREWNLVCKLQGEVEEVDLPDRPGEAVVTFGTSRRWFPLSRLEAIGAAFPGALVEYCAYESGRLFLSDLAYIGPSAEEMEAEPLDQLSQEEIVDLEDVGLYPPRGQFGE